MKGLPIQQPYCELILRGLKTVEYRSRRTHFRGTCYLYATKNGPPADQAAAWVEETYGVEIDVANLPRGVLVGTIEIVGCREGKGGGFEWLLANPTRLATPRRPAKMPCSPSFFEAD
jgi:hypothetical protein